MKYLLLLFFCMIFFHAFGQKIKYCEYDKVDTVRQYMDGVTITYKNKQGVSITDTIVYSISKRGVTIGYADFVGIREQKYLKPKKKP